MNPFFIRDTFCIYSAAPKEKEAVDPRLVALAGRRWSAHCICDEAPQEKVAVDPHLVTAKRDGAHIVFVAKLSRRRWHSTHTLLLQSGTEHALYLW